MPKRVLITGATSGLGQALVAEARASGWSPLLSGRRAQPSLPAEAHYIQGDIRDPGLQQALVEADAYDCAILNAGQALRGDFFAHSYAAVERLLETNLLAPLQIAHRLGPLPLKLLGSAAAFAPLADMAVYAASKAGLAAFARALQGEQRDAQLWVPAGLNTPMHPQPSARFQDPNLAARKLWRGAGWIVYPESKARVLDQFSRRYLDQGHRRTPLRPLSATRALVTGASQGLGKALADALTQKGVALLGLDRQDGLSLRYDLADPSTPEALVAQLKGQPPFDLLVHNAGVTWAGDFYAMPLEQIETIVRVNVISPILLTLALRQAGLLAKGAGLVAISSLSHQIGYPYAAVYAASKSALAVWASLLGRGSDLSVLTLFPGPMDTAQAEIGRLGGKPAPQTLAPERVAAQLVAALEQRRRGSLIPHPTNRILSLLGRRIAPHWMTAAFGRQQRRYL